MAKKQLLLSCPACRKKVSSDAHICINCGQQLTDEWERQGRARLRKNQVLGGFVALMTIGAVTTAAMLNGSGKPFNHADAQSSNATDAILQSLRQDPSAPLNPAFKDEYSSIDGRKGVEDAPRTAAGYPIIGLVKAAPLCTDVFQLQLAADLVASNQPDKANRIPGCRVFPPGTFAEWVKPNVLNKGYNEFRLPISSGPPLTVYGPDGNGSEQPFYAWFGTLKK